MNSGTATMNRTYFEKRLLQALDLADQAASPKERSVYLRASLHYCELLGLPSWSSSSSDPRDPRPQ
jgi:hypothetical protein